MAINTLKGITEIDGNGVMSDIDRPTFGNGSVDWVLADGMREDYPICVDHEKDMISFKMMTEPASKGGSGCQFTTLIETAKIMLEYLNNKFPCEDNQATIIHLRQALMWQKKRTEDRIKRGVEGKDEA